MVKYVGKIPAWKIDRAVKDDVTYTKETLGQIETGYIWKENKRMKNITTKQFQILTDMQFEVETVSYVQDGRIYCNINTSNNSILIGKAGVILRAINLIIKNAVSTTFKKRLEVSVDINGYKEERYKKVASMARRFGKTVLRTKADLKLDPMPADERKVMHQEIAKMDHLKTESKGEGKNRYMTISYVD